MTTQELRHRLSEIVEAALGELRAELERKLDGYRSQLESAVSEALETHQRQLETERSREPAEAPAPVDAAPATVPILPALRRIESARDQAAVVESLLDSTTSAASRAAFLLADQEGFSGWGARGFDADHREMQRVQMRRQGGWLRLSEQAGYIELSAAECAQLASRLEAPVPRRGVLIPFLLQGRLAGVVYADQLKSEDELDVDRLSVLTYVAARAVETLPLRDGPALATLTPAGQGGAPLEPWPPPGAPTPSAPTPPVTDDQATTSELPPTEELVEEAEEPLVEETEADLDVAVEAEPAADEVAEALEEEAEASVEAPAEEVTAEEAPAEESLVEVEELEEEPAEMEGPAEVEEIEEVEEEEEPTEEESAAAPATPEGEDEAAGDVTTAAVPEPGPAAPESPRASRASAPGPGGYEVAPPEDLVGPGWAFRQQDTSQQDREILQAEARRLARLLVSEIKLYHEVEVWEGRKQGNIYELLREEIDRSRELYEERVDPEIREERDFFHDELVRQLADGDARALGI